MFPEINKYLKAYIVPTITAYTIAYVSIAIGPIAMDTYAHCELLFHIKLEKYGRW